MVKKERTTRHVKLLAQRGRIWFSEQKAAARSLSSPWHTRFFDKPMTTVRTSGHLNHSTGRSNEVTQCDKNISSLGRALYTNVGCSGAGWVPPYDCYNCPVKHRIWPAIHNSPKNNLHNHIKHTYDSIASRKRISVKRTMGKPGSPWNGLVHL